MLGKRKNTRPPRYAMRGTVTILAAALLPFCATDSNAEVRRYLVVFVSGERLEGEAIVGWHRRVGTPMLDSTSLQGEGRQLRWLRDRQPATTASPEHADAFVEFIGGDRVPGRVVAYVPESQDGEMDQPAHLLVDSRVSLDRPGDEPRQHLRVLPENIRRVTWKAVSRRRLSPGTVFSRDGGRLGYRTLRWQHDSVRILTGDAIREIPFDQISELHLPQRDDWQAYFQELAVLSPDGKSRLLRLETTAGLIATGSEARFDAIAYDTPRQRDPVALRETIKRLERHRLDLLARQKEARRRHEEMAAEWRRKEELNEQYLQRNMRNMRSGLKTLPEAEREEKIKQFEDETVTRWKQGHELGRRRLETLLETGMRRYEQHLDGIDKQLEQLNRDSIPGRASPNRWYHMVYPAWSLDPLWIRFATIRTRWSFAPHEVPLTRLQPAKTVQRSTFGSSWTWQANRNVQRHPLRSAGQEYGWGFGVQATNELHFGLPSFAQAFRTFVGLDGMVGPGGCARAAVYLNAVDGEPLFQSALLIGSGKVVDTGALTLTDLDIGQQTLVLVVDAAHEDRPAGADPLDVRDHVDWLEPILLLDPVQLQAEVQKCIE